MGSLASRLSDDLKARIVELILESRLREALAELSEAMGVPEPRFRVGHVKGHSSALAVYVPSRETIFFSSGEAMRDPLVVLHEFYHHARMFAGRHRGTERHADEFAADFVRAYLRRSRGSRSDGGPGRP